MKITIEQSEIETAIKSWLTAQGFIHDEKNVDINFNATRSPAGISAEIKLSPMTIVNKIEVVPEPEEKTSIDDDIDKAAEEVEIISPKKPLFNN